jgi:hypothetical protein
MDYGDFFTTARTCLEVKAPKRLALPLREPPEKGKHEHKRNAV